MFTEVFLKKVTDRILLFLSGLCIIGVFSLLFCLQSVSACNTFDNDNTSVSRSFNNDIAPGNCNIRNSNLPGSKIFSSNRRTQTSGRNSAECLQNDCLEVLKYFLLTRKSQTISLFFNLNCKFITCVTPVRAGPASL